MASIVTGDGKSYMI